MRSRIGAGIVAGLVAGIVWGVLLTLMQTPMPPGDTPSMMTRIGRAVGSESLAAAWGAHLLISVALGVLFALIVGRRARRPEAAVAGGLAYGLVVWAIGGQVVMPLLLGEPVFGFVRTLGAIPYAIGSLLGHVIFGTVLGGGVAWLNRTDEAQPTARSARRRRAA
ncbi:MAG: hypothetical protein ACREM3_14530 [Candidatus Rokuibacteriota bacterium]